MMTTNPPLAVERTDSRRGLLLPQPPRRVIRVCLKHERPLRDTEMPMRCELGHPVDDAEGWAAVDAVTGKIVGHPAGELRKGEMP